MDTLLSWNSLYGGFFRRLRSSWLACGLLSTLAFLPLAGLTLLSPEQKGGVEWEQFVLASLVLCRFLTPLAACLIVTYLARQDGRLPKSLSLWKSAAAHFLRSVGLVLAVAFFASLAALFFILPGIGFLLGSSVGMSVLVIEQTSVPEAVRRSWERTRDARDCLFGFWCFFLAGSVGAFSAVAIFFTNGHPSELLLHPLAESPALLPLVATASFLYGALCCANYEIYCQLQDRLQPVPELSPLAEEHPSAPPELMDDHI